MPDIVGILLAAGQSSRFGHADKLLATLADGTPLVLAAARPLQAVLSRVIAVIPDNAPELHHLLTKNGLEVIACTESTHGMGASIACGVRASFDASGWLIALGDMPCISATVVQEIVTALETRAPLVRPVCRNRVGHPVGFAHRFADKLLQLKNDQGGQCILKQHAQLLRLLPTEDNGIHTDIDTPSHLATVNGATT